jgi:vacuolar-type H+-ATPase subunit H
MAGESILRIREKEKEASKLVSGARLDAKRIVQDARGRMPAFIEEKDALLKREEETIRETRRKESEGIVRGLEQDERKEIEEIDGRCARNLKNVVLFISSEIVKE